MSRKAILFMLTSTVCFAIVNAIVKTLGHLPAFEKVLFRCIISLSITFYLLGKAKISPWGNNKKFLIIRGLSGSVALTLFFLVMDRIPLASAVTLQYLSPIATSIFGIILLKEKVAVRQWLFFAVSLTGVVMMKGFDTRVDTLSVIMGVISAGLSGLAYASIRKVKDTDHPLVVVLYFPLVATPLLLSFIGLFHLTPLSESIDFPVWTMPRNEDWFLLLLIGIFTQIAQVTMTKALQAENVAQVTSLKYLGSILALAVGYSFFDETYGLMALLGIIVVLLGVFLNVMFKTKNSIV